MLTLPEINPNDNTLDIVSIYPDSLFAIKFDDKDHNEYDAAFSLWRDLDYLVDFFDENKNLLETGFWHNAVSSTDSEDLAQSVVNESFDFEKHIKEIAANTANGEMPDFDDFFQELGGQYKFLREHVPHKSYGTASPTMLRLYAIRVSANCYVVVHGGIKLTKQIQDTPQLKKELFSKIDNVLRFFKANGIIDTEDLMD